MTLPVPGDNFAGLAFHYAYQAVDSTNFTATDSSQVITLYNIDQPNVWVKEILTRVTTAFYAGNTLTIGDTDDADGFMKTAMIGATVIAASDSVQWKSSAGANSTALAGLVGTYAAGGKLYSDTTKVVEMTFTSNTTAGHTVGALQVCAVYTVLP
jgi:hypothetical protein